ncbi:Protein ccc1 [Elasticomyces elasticus]|nr:Protein ccc1 [Elasticomyces elasticus]KAK3638825.1 Protein ccc1 [Elasticomyces elasticus]KAK4913139.1 Protein ccc1 [Elasticomyces elasticus]KAK5752354.1 Protein ccc1 [Elasticomyces elasticus]
MAAVLIKSLLFPKAKTAYTSLPLRESNLPGGVERAASTDSAIAMSESFVDEKISGKENGTTSTRINPRIISDATIGLSDGLTVPFALTAGLSALGDTNVVIYGGLAELIAGGISMGLGGYLGAKSEAEAYQAALRKTKATVDNDNRLAASLVRNTFSRYDIAEDTLASIIGSLLDSPADMVDFIMRFHHQLVEADYAPSRAYVSGVTIATGYVLGGLVALLPYLFISGIQHAFFASAVLMALALFAFGWAKTALVGEGDRWICFKNGVQMLLLGGVAAGASMGCVKAIG